MPLLTKWLKQKLTLTHARGFVVGLSGGIDSAVVSALIKKAAPRNHLCVIMPCGKINQTDLKDAFSVVEKFRLNSLLVDLTPVYDVLVKTFTTVSLPSTIKGLTSSSRLSLANLKPRLRMITLYYFANRLNYLVVGTGNKSELSVGYFTKYGDGGVDILPLGGFYKSEVVALARELKIPPRVISKPPSAGLWDGQTDEGEMGVTYDAIEKILRLYFSKKVTSTKSKSVIRELANTLGIENHLVQKVLTMYNNSKHKRTMPDIFNPTEKI